MSSSIERRRALLMGATVATGSAVPDTTRAQADATVAPSFSGRSVLITGGTSGIGEAVAIAFARAGASVAFNGRRAALGRAVEDRLNADPQTRSSGGRALYVESDVRDEEQVRRFVAVAAERHGGLHVAFNNAGVVFGSGELRGNRPLAEVETASFDDVLATNARGIFVSMRHELPVMLRNAPWGRFGLRGVVVNTASVSGHGGFAGIAAYSASKHAVLGLTRCAALDYGPRGLRVVSISPGGVDTPIRRAAIEAQGRDPAASPAPNIAHRTNTVEEMADVVLWLAQADAPSSIQGTDIDVTMGMLTGPLTPPAPQGGRT